MVVNGRPLKRAKSRVTADLYDFLTFPAGGDGIWEGEGLEGPFRSNVRAFLSRHGRLSPPSPSILSPAMANLLTWRVAFRVGGESKEEEAAAVELDVVEEDVARARSVYCDQCRVGGWSGHPVCGKRYHFIIRNDSNPLAGNRQTCIRCGSMLHMLDSRCISCNYEMTAEDLEDWAYLQLEDTTHLLHGVVHANGYGHLLRVNGREGGSRYLTGHDIMGFWDRLCKLLRVRKVTVMDISKKYGMEYRLLNAVIAGQSWYGNWDYKFGAGSYAVTAEAYHRAVETLSNMPLSSFFANDRSARTPLQNTIALYWSLSDCELMTVRNLFCYISHFHRDVHAQSMPKISSAEKKLTEATTSCRVLCAWTTEDIKQAEDAMVKVLRAVERSQWVGWRALRGATFRAVKSQELLDYCLRGLGGRRTDDGLVVAARFNSEACTIEYRLEAAADPSLAIQVPCRPSADQLLRDLKFLYDALLNPATMLPYKPKGMYESALTSAAKLLDCKQFVKHYDEPTPGSSLSSNPFALYIWCHVELVDQPKDYTAPPPELLVLPITATVADLKLQATKAFQETYIIFQRFQAEQLLDYRHVSDSTNIKLLLGTNGVVRVKGRCLGDERLGLFRMERGIENWTVDCTCGAKDDDGERMMACDECGVWQHTRCAGVSDFDMVPAEFICRKCMGLQKLKACGGGGSSIGRFKACTTNGGRCKDEIASTPSPADAGAYGCMTTVG